MITLYLLAGIFWSAYITKKHNSYYGSELTLTFLLNVFFWWVSFGNEWFSWRKLNKDAKHQDYIRQLAKHYFSKDLLD